MKPHHSTAMLRDFATTLGLILAFILYSMVAQWVFIHAPWVGWGYLVMGIPATFIVIAALRVGGDS